MIAYNKSLLEQTFLVQEARNLNQAGFINNDQFRLIENQLPGLKTQNSLLIRIGLFLVGLILCASICGVLSLFAISVHNTATTAVIAFIFSGICFGVLEWLIAVNRYCGYGLDDAFLFSGQIGLVTGLCIALDAMGLSDVWLIWCAIIGLAVMTTFCAMRYLNVLSTLGACLSWTLVIGYWMVEAKWTIMPLIMMLVAALFVVFFTYLKRQLKAVYYLKLAQTAIYYSYILFYLAGNIWVIIRFSYYFSYSENADPSMLLLYLSYFYWVVTFAIPLVYILRAIKVRDKGWLWIGIATSFYSFYNLFALTYFLTTDWWLTLAGTFLFGATLWGITKIRYREIGLTFEPDLLNDDVSFVDAEALIVAAQLGIKPEAAQEDPMKFGGGGFSGGGAGGSY